MDNATVFANSFTYNIEHFYDIRVVWTSKIQINKHFCCDSCELGNRIFWILFSGTSKPYWAQLLYCATTKNYARSDLNLCILYIFYTLSKRKFKMELCCWSRINFSCRILRLQKVGLAISQPNFSKSDSTKLFNSVRHGRAQSHNIVITAAPR